MRAAVKVALLLGTIWSCPLVVTDATLEVQVKLAVSRAIWQAAEGIAVWLAAVVALPALPAQAHATDANSVTGTVRVQAVDFFTMQTLVTGKAPANSVQAVPVAGAVRDFALVFSELALLPLPAWLAGALAAGVLASPTAQHWTHAKAQRHSRYAQDSPA